jgi:hypothetical protein
MPEDYDRLKCAALAKEAREITDHLKAEAESIRRQLARVLEGGEDEPPDAPEGPRVANISERKTGRSFWQFWR